MFAWNGSLVRENWTQKWPNREIISRKLKLVLKKGLLSRIQKWYTDLTECKRELNSILKKIFFRNPCLIFFGYWHLKIVLSKLMCDNSWLDRFEFHEGLTWMKPDGLVLKSIVFYTRRTVILSKYIFQTDLG